MSHKHEVKLTPKARERLLSIVSKGVNKASVIRCAHVLLKSDEGRTDVEISEQVYVSEDTVRNIRIRFCQAGLEAALSDHGHPARAPKLDDQQAAYLVALACSQPPAGRDRWTLELLATHLAAEGIARVSPATVRLTLKKTGLSPGR